MNREQAKKLLPIIQAFADGAPLQYRVFHGDWKDIENASFAVDNEYRIKPKPLEC